MDIEKNESKIAGVLATSQIDIPNVVTLKVLKSFSSIPIKKVWCWTANIVGQGVQGLASQAPKMQRTGLKPNSVNSNGI